MSDGTRVAWVDTAKGLCIIMVVMVHSVLGLELAAGQQGWMHHVVSFARPFRMPDFFLISGLFLGLVIDRPWRRYIDRKVVHFAYFYVLWLTIQFAFKAPGMAMEGGWRAPLEAYALAFVQPFGTLWFIYILPLFFLFTRLVRTLPAWLVFVWAAVMEILPVHTGSVIFDEFASRYVYFFVGYAFAAHVFSFAERVRARPGLFLAGLAVWAPLNAALVFTPAPDALVPWLQADLGNSGATGGLSELPVVSLGLGLAGSLVVVGVAALLSGRAAMRWLVWLGAHSIVVYLAFFLPMAVTRVVLLKTGLIPDIGLASAVVTAAAVAGPVVLYGLVRWTGRGRFLFERPGWARIERPGPVPDRARVAAS
ncbi:acyltransferase family protein [Aquibium sp. A9E412]|uniref:acyltransferase family protein n=1 Tax=Aquibium sp. A9E412 TaxID=2976767 RepID=UPI0025B171BF|nr:acyltransferase family protein [Aquibium sp. A9E412]MDN2568129.1 acyltransferase family protein [Aquibium sp. A9E412]